MFKWIGIVVLSFSFIAAASDFEKEKLENQRIQDNCLDPDVMDASEKEVAEKMTVSLRSFMQQNSSEEERKRGFDGAIKMIVYKKDKTLFVFSRHGSLTAQPSSLLRAEERALLNEKVQKWVQERPEFQMSQIFIRFNDECSVPDLCTDLYLDGSFLSRLRAFLMLCK